MQGEIQKIYDLYPTRDENNSNRSTGKCGKDKDKIKKLIIEKKPIEKLIREYVEDCKQTKIYLKGFSVFLNQLPETPEKQEAIQKPKQANLGLAYIQQEFFKND